MENNASTSGVSREDTHPGLEIPALGRPFTLGMLYNCREDKLIPGFTLWNREDLAENICIVPQNHTEFEVLTSDTVADKSSALNISGSLNLSLLSGMIEVEGSGKYLTDRKESKNQARATLRYTRTTKFEQLSMNHLGCKNISYPEVLDNGIATHVVTGILYGARAFFIFDQKLISVEKPEDAQGKLKGMLIRMGNPTGNVQMSKQETEAARQFSCKFYGDFILEKNPVTYEEAMEICSSLPKLTGENGDHAVPMRVWFYPLRNLGLRAAPLVRDVSDRLVFMAENIMEQMSEVVMECTDTMRHPAATAFPPLLNKTKQFKKLFEHFRVMFQKQMAQVLPSVRSGNVEESALENILARKEQSPFSDRNIRTFLSRRQLEMEVVHALLKQLSGFRVVSEQRELRNAILCPRFEQTICFNFSSLTCEDSYLSHLESWLYRETWELPDTFNDGETRQWFEEGEISKQGRELVKEFKGFVNTDHDYQFLVTSVADRPNPEVSIDFYRSGNLVPYRDVILHRKTKSRLKKCK